ncbi:hypothetical protein LINPERHAP1_LOCUS31949 [Linum perenne]
MAPATTDYSGILTTHRLDGKNYLQWSKTVEMHITGRSRGGYLSGATKKPAPEDPQFQTWNDNDNLVRTWLIHSMMPSIGENYLLHSTAQAIWEAARTTYSTVDNSSALFEVETQLFHLKQGDKDATEYFNMLGRYWLHLDMYEAQTWDTPADQERFKRYIEKKRTLYFLLGLNQNLDDVKGRIMSTKPFPTLTEAFSEIKREESRRQLMNPDTKGQVESSALAVRSQQKPRQQQYTPNQARDRDDDAIPVCDHCHKQWHTKAECWELVGKPADWKPRQERRRRAHVAASEKQAETEVESGPFSKEQANALEKFFSKVLSKASQQPPPPDMYSGLFASQGGRLREDDWNC